MGPLKKEGPLTNYRLFTISRLSTETQWSIQLSLQLLWETHGLAQWNMTGDRLFGTEPIGNILYWQAAIFKILNWRFKIKAPAGWDTNVSIEIYQLLLLFGIISPCSKGHQKFSFLELFSFMHPCIPHLLTMA